MKFYHGTTKEAWDKIQKEGCLRGVREIKGLHPNRCTYLAIDKKEAEQYGDMVLEVEYNPTNKHDNYTEGCWQFRVYEPISIDKIRFIH